MVNTEIKAKIAELLKDQYVNQWLNGLTEKSKGNYLRGILSWNDFIEMTPTEQIKRRIEDLNSKDLAARSFFESKFREYKQKRETETTLAPLSIKSELRTIASFFGRTTGKLNLRRGDWNSTQSTRIKNKLTLKLDDVKAMYSHGSLRDRCLLLALSQSGFSEVDVTEFRIEDLKGFYETPISTHYFLEKPREKTGEIQATCLSFEAVHDLRDLLAEKGNPKKGFIFTSQTKNAKIEDIDPETKEKTEIDAPIEVRRIHESMKNLAEKALGSERAKEFKTKHLRSLYNSALLRADIKSEVKDLMMGHQRLGSRGHYGYDEQTIKDAYTKAFEFVSINGMQSREDLVKIKENLNNLIGSQQVEIETRKAERKADLERIAKLEDFIRNNTATDPNTIKRIVLEALKEQQNEKVKID